MGNVYESYLKTLSYEDLNVLWDEIEEWERVGSIPMDAKLREVTTAANPDLDLSWPGEAKRPAGMDAMQLTYCQREVWHEIARRYREGYKAAQQVWIDNTDKDESRAMNEVLEALEEKL